MSEIICLSDEEPVEPERKKPKIVKMPSRYMQAHCKNKRSDQVSSTDLEVSSSRKAQDEDSGLGSIKIVSAYSLNSEYCNAKASTTVCSQVSGSSPSVEEIQTVDSSTDSMSPITIDLDESPVKVREPTASTRSKEENYMHQLKLKRKVPEWRKVDEVKPPENGKIAQTPVAGPMADADVVISDSTQSSEPIEEAWLYEPSTSSGPSSPAEPTNDLTLKQCSIVLSPLALSEPLSPPEECPSPEPVESGPEGGSEEEKSERVAGSPSNTKLLLSVANSKKKKAIATLTSPKKYAELVRVDEKENSSLENASNETGEENVASFESNKKLFQDFLDKCCELETVPKDRVKLRDKMNRNFENCDVSFLSSEQFTKLMNEELSKLTPQGFYFSIKRILEDLKAKKKSKQPKVPDPIASTSRESQPFVSTENVPLNEQKTLDKIDKTLEKLKTKIKRLEMDEVDLEDEDDSSYLRLDRYQKRYTDLYKKRCEITGEDMFAGRRTKKKLQLTGMKYPKVNRCIELYVNKNGTFPDFEDVEKLLKDKAPELNISVRDELGLHAIAKYAFEEVGKALQKRRQLDAYDSLLAFSETLDDPALHDAELNSRLEKNYRTFQKREAEVMEYYVQKQNAKAQSTETTDGGSEAAEDQDEESSEEEEEKREDSDSSDDNDESEQKDNTKETVQRRSEKSRPETRNDSEKENDCEVVIGTPSSPDSSSSECEIVSVGKSAKPLVVEINRVLVETMPMKVGYNKFRRKPILRELNNLALHRGKKKSSYGRRGRSQSIGKAVIVKEFLKSVAMVQVQDPAFRLTVTNDFPVKSHGTIVNGEVTNQPESCNKESTANSPLRGNDESRETEGTNSPGQGDGGGGDDPEENRKKSHDCEGDGKVDDEENEDADDEKANAEHDVIGEAWKAGGSESSPPSDGGEEVLQVDSLQNLLEKSNSDVFQNAHNAELDAADESSRGDENENSPQSEERGVTMEEDSQQNKASEDEDSATQDIESLKIHLPEETEDLQLSGDEEDKCLQDRDPLQNDDLLECDVSDSCDSNSGDNLPNSKECGVVEKEHNEHVKLDEITGNEDRSENVDDKTPTESTSNREEGDLANNEEVNPSNDLEEGSKETALRSTTTATGDAERSSVADERDDAEGKTDVISGTAIDADDSISKLDDENENVLVGVSISNDEFDDSEEPDINNPSPAEESTDVPTNDRNSETASSHDKKESVEEKAQGCDSDASTIEDGGDSDSNQGEKIVNAGEEVKTNADQGVAKLKVKKDLLSEEITQPPAKKKRKKAENKVEPEPEVESPVEYYRKPVNPKLRPIAPKAPRKVPTVPQKKLVIPASTRSNVRISDVQVVSENVRRTNTLSTLERRSKPILQTAALEGTVKPRVDAVADERVQRFLQNAGSSVSITVKRKRPMSEETKQALEQLKKLKNISATRVPRSDPDIMVIEERDATPSTSRAPQPSPLRNSQPSPLRRPQASPLRNSYMPSPSTSPYSSLLMRQTPGLANNNRGRSMRNSSPRATLARGSARFRSPQANGLPFISSVQSCNNARTPVILAVRGSSPRPRGQNFGRGLPLMANRANRARIAPKPSTQVVPYVVLD